jgi:hypothetical protein
MLFWSVTKHCKCRKQGIVNDIAARPNIVVARVQNEWHRHEFLIGVVAMCRSLGLGGFGHGSLRLEMLNQIISERSTWARMIVGVRDSVHKSAQ